MSPSAIDLGADPAQVGSTSSITNPASWASLPVEIRQMILSKVSWPRSRSGYNFRGSLPVGRFAAVCRDWQVFFEACTFRRLVLDSGRLDEFAAIITRDDTRLGYIRQLWFRVRLSTYECPDCDEPENKAIKNANNAIFTSCIQSLLGTLTLWDPARHGAEGLELMLSASSPSDAEHRYTWCEVMDGHDLDLAPGQDEIYWTHATDPVSFGSHCSQSPPLDHGHIKRFQGAPLCLEIQGGERGRVVSQYESLPAVPIVKELVMRKQDRRAIHAKALAWLLSQSFVALERFRFERTISPEPKRQLSFDQAFQQQVLPSLPETLRQLSFTQWEIPKAERGVPLDPVGTEISQHAQDYLPLEMATISQRLERFCPPWQMDTAAFLRFVAELGEPPMMGGSSLKHIILRCSFPNPSRCRQDFAGLVILAAEAALWLPRLQVIELWGTSIEGREGRAYLFRYTCLDSRAKIVWRSCEKSMAAGTRIVAKWSEVAQKHSHSTLLHSVVPFWESKKDIAWTYGTCMYPYLRLKDLVFDPMTQKVLENEPYEPRSDDEDTGEESDSSQEG